MSENMLVNSIMRNTETVTTILQISEQLNDMRLNIMINVNLFFSSLKKQFSAVIFGKKGLSRMFIYNCNKK